MLPVLLSIGSFRLYSLGVFLVLAWCIWSFRFWRSLRNQAVEESKIFDLMFYGSLIALVSARFGYIVFHIPAFADNWLRVVAIWIAPGLTMYGALIGGFAAMFVLALSYRVRILYYMDAFVSAFGPSFIAGTIGTFLDGSVVGKATALPWAVRYVGHQGFRHPVQLYMALAVVAIMLVHGLLSLLVRQKKLRTQIPSILYFLFFAVASFGIEFVSEGSVYWYRLSANQWIAVGLFAEALGALYVRGGGKEWFAPYMQNVSRFGSRLAGGIYARFPGRALKRDSQTS